MRKTPGVSSIKNGQDFYSAVLKWHISTDQTPQEVHDIGLKEVEKIKQGVAEVIQQLGKNITFREFSEEVRNDQSQQFSSKQDALDFYRNLYRDKINPQLHKLLPDDTLTLDVMERLGVSEAPPPGGPFAYYEEPSKDGLRRGTFYIKLEPLSTQKIYEGTTLALHEGT